MSGTPKKSSSSPYQVLGNRPIDQWKVTELKEELKRRKLITRGLKDDLVKRLDEALRIERDCVVAVSEAEVGLSGVASDNIGTLGRGTGESGKDFETPKKDEESKFDKTDDDWVKVDPIEGHTVTGELNEEDAVVASGMGSGKEEILVVQKTFVEIITEAVLTETPMGAHETDNEIEKSALQTNEIMSRFENVNSKSEIGSEDSEGSRPPKDNEKHTHDGIVDSNTKVFGSEGRVKGTSKTIETSDQVPASGLEDAHSSANQVSDVGPSLGLDIKSGSISSVSVTIVEKTELKDNIIDDNVTFELNLKPEMVQPSSVNVAPDAGGSHPMDVEDSLDKKLSADEKDGNATSVSKTNVDIEYPENLKLDRSSEDDSMDEDVFDNKQIYTKTSSRVYEDKNKQVEVKSKDELVVDVVSEGKEDSHVTDKGVVTAEKRKLSGHQSVGINEPVKRQRRWITDPVKVAESQITATAFSATPKENISPAVGRHGLLRPDSIHSEDATKERVGELQRVVPPSANPPTNSLRIDRFLRPFTLKAVQELLGKTGKVVSFWMDQIKTHCYVTYSSIEEATETRNAVYNLQWPTNGGRLLIADFVEPQEVKNRVELPYPSPAAPISAPPPPQTAAPTKQPQPSARQVQRQQPPIQTSFPSPPQLSVPPPIPEKLEPPIVTLDDLFRKTTTLPRIYYLPLSEEKVAEKNAAREKNIKT